MLDDMIAAADRQDAAEKVRDEKFVMSQRILDELGPRLWTALQRALKDKCNQHPTRFVYEVSPSSEAVVRGKRTFLRINYLAAANRVIYHIDQIGGEYRVQLNDDGDAIFADTAGRPYPSAEYIAERLLANLLCA